MPESVRAAALLGVLTFIAPAGSSGQLRPTFHFVAAAEEVGLLFEHRHGGTGERYLVETMGSGVATVDYDADGRTDVYFVQSAATPGYEASGALRNRLFRNLSARSGGAGRFADVTTTSGAGDPAYGQGVAAADYDNDGFVDLYVTNYGPNVLLRGNGDGTFADVSARAGVDDARWGVSAAWGDVDLDGDLDLYAVNYLDFRWDNHRYCGKPHLQLQAYCSPEVYAGVSNVLYRNDGDGFTDISEAAGVVNPEESKGLGVIFVDYDDDGDPDIYVANDSTRNFLYTNDGRVGFVDDALVAGAGFNKDGQVEGGMGVDAGDYDGDGTLDIVVTNLDLETNTLYRGLETRSFSDATFDAGLSVSSFMSVGFGTNWIDVNNDGDLDLFVANGHVNDLAAQLRQGITYRQPNHLYLNVGDGRFDAAHARLTSGPELAKVSRGSAVADLDEDGDLDIVVSNNNQTADYLRNDGGNRAGAFIQLLLVGSQANRSASGARLHVQLEGQARVMEVRTGSSYASTSTPRLHVGLGEAQAADVTIRWPGGVVERIDRLVAGRLYVVREGRGAVASRRLN